MNESQKILRQLVKQHGRAKTRIILCEMQEILDFSPRKSEPKAQIIKAI